MPTELPDFEETPLQPELKLTDEVREYLKMTAKWSYFLSIVGFCGVALLVILAFFIGAIFSMFLPPDFELPMSTAGYAGTYLVMALLYFFPVLYLYRFASRMKYALKHDDQDALNQSFGQLKGHYQFLGILTIVFIALYGIIMVFGFFAAVIGGIL